MSVGGALLLAGLRAAVAGVAALWLAERTRIAPSVRHGLVVAGLALHLALFASAPLIPAARLEVLPGWARPPAVAPIPVGGPTLAAVIAETSAGSVSAALPTASPSPAPRRPVGPAGLALLGWMVVVLAILVSRTRDLLAAARLVRQAPRSADRRVGDLVDRAARPMGLPAVTVRLLPRGRPPAVWGFRRPTLLLPVDAIHWSHDRLDAVTRHELAHLRRGDLLVQHAAALVTALFWWSPVAWMLERRRAELAEACCDARVIAGGTAPADYAALLLGTVRELRGRALVGSIGFARGGSDRRLERRVRAILAPPGAAALWRTGAAIAIVGLVVVGTAAFEPVARRSIGLSPLDVGASASATGCRYQGGRHLNRLTDVSGPFEWQVSWDGAGGCRVEFVADQEATLAIERGEVDALPSGASFTVRLTSPEASRVVTVHPTPGGLQVEVRGGSAEVPEDWVARFVGELDLHTGYAAYRTVPALLAEGGVDAVLDRVAAATGDHAGLRYLSTLVDATTLDRRQLASVLERARVTGDNEAELVALLERIARRYPLDDGALREAFARVAARLRTEAGRVAIAALAPF
ncbi:MAG: M56 family metallopeptidase [Gemmatimonadales bacterium]